MKGHRRREALVPELAEQAKKTFWQASQSFDGDLEVQCILAMAVLANYHSPLGSMWHLVGLAISRCYSLGLHTASGAMNEAGRNPTQRLSRAFVSAYILDAFVHILTRLCVTLLLTYGSTLGSSLDRPFSIRDQDVAIHGPENVFADTEYAGMSPVTLQYAQVLRIIRERAERGATFHLANFENWHDSATHCLDRALEPKDLMSLQIGRMSSQLIVSIVQTTHSAGRTDSTELLAETAERTLSEYLTKLQQLVRT